MTFIVKFLAKSLTLFVLETAELISDLAGHIFSPGRIGYRIASQINLLDFDGDKSVPVEMDFLRRSRYLDQTSFSIKYLKS